MKKIIRCKRCGKNFDFDKTYGLCPNCGLSNASALNNYNEESVYKGNDLEFKDEYHNHNEPLFDNLRGTINGENINTYNQENANMNDYKNKVISLVKRIFNDIKNEQDEEMRKRKIGILIFFIFIAIQSIRFFLDMILNIFIDLFS